MKNLILISLFVFSNWAVADICMVDVKPGSFQPVAWACKDVQPYILGMDVLSLGLEAGALYAACTGFGVPVTATLGVAGIAVKATQMIVSRLPCEDTEEEERMKTFFKASVCEELNEMGLKCDPGQVQIQERN